MSSHDEYIWIARWEEFQHYRPERNRGPAWIKNYTSQLSDGRYLALSEKSRSVLHDLRICFATMRGQLPNSTQMISGLIHQRVTNVTLKLLSDAGFIEIISRNTLEKRLEKLYSRSRSKEVEEEHPLTPSQKRGGNGRITNKDLRRYTGCRMTRGTHGYGWKHDPLGTDKPPADWPYPPPTKDDITQALTP